MVTTKVVLADDHVPMRQRIRQALEASGCEVCAEAGSAEEAVRLVTQHTPDVALLDIHMPGNGIQAARAIAATAPGTSVVMLTQSASEEDVFDSLRAGAAGYLLKDGDPSRLGDSLRGVLAGEGAMSPRLVAMIMDEFRAPARRRLAFRSPAAAKLTPREWEVMQLLGEGLSTDEVAKRLFLSTTTIRVHVSTVLKKLRVRDRRGAFDLLRNETR